MASMDTARPHTAMGYYNKKYNNCSSQVKLGDDLLLPGFQKHLKDFYMKATAEDRLKCANLITALDESDRRNELLYNDNTSTVIRHKRPKTAMSNLEQYRDSLDPYRTTYKREYTALPLQLIKPFKARTSLHPNPPPAPRRTTTYETEYCHWGKHAKTEPESADPHRKNNPHPTKEFIMWRLPRGAKIDHGNNNNWELTDQIFDDVIRGQLVSSYQKDYVGIPLGKEGVKTVKLAFGELKDTRNSVQYTLDSSTRHTYQVPEVQPELAPNTTRYGCNKQKQLAVTGVVPMISSRYLKVKPRTTYEREYSYCNNRTIAAKELQKKKESEMWERNQLMLKPQSPASRQSSFNDVYPTQCVETASSLEYKNY